MVQNVCRLFMCMFAECPLYAVRRIMSTVQKRQWRICLPFSSSPCASRVRVCSQVGSRVEVSPSSLFVGPQSTGPGGTALGDLLQRILSVSSASSTEGTRGAVILQQISCECSRPRLVARPFLLSSSVSRSPVVHSPSPPLLSRLSSACTSMAESDYAFTWPCTYRLHVLLFAYTCLWSQCCSIP